MSSTMIYGIHPIETLLQEAPEQLLSVVFLGDKINSRQEKIVQLAKKHQIKLSYLAKDKFYSLIDEGITHQGVLAYVNEKQSWHESDLLSLIQGSAQPLILILDGIQDPHNLGACLRSANAAGVTAVIAPKDNAALITATVRKVACGAEQFTPFIPVTNLARTLKLLKEAGLWLIGLEGEAEQTLYEMDMRGPIGIIMGSEGSGMRRLTKENCDFLVKIPMYGQIESLNVSNACAVTLFEAVRQRRAER